MNEDVTVAILAKDKEQCLPLYLDCILKQTYPKDKIHLYVRSNNNTDDSIRVLDAWLEKHSHAYKSVFVDYKDVRQDITNCRNHEWNSTRFKVMSKIRQDSVRHAQKMNSSYFVADCDNFITQDTLASLQQSNLSVVAPLLYNMGSYYSNYHHKVDANGYYANSDQYYWLHDQKVRGLIEVDVVHCTYFIRQDALKDVSYYDDTDRHEYVIFSDNCRKSGLKQYLDNRRVYGLLTFLKDNAVFSEEEFKKSLEALEVKS